ncbi:MAG TPA: hypothetical protein ENL06_03500 [Candidatus Portnoybacteria bacterium]|nr:hypothetical protein [Candidatus Portnoybacteria bacterium]
MSRRWFLIIFWGVIITNFLAVAIIWLTKSLETGRISPYLFFYLSLWLGTGGLFGYIGFKIREKLVKKVKWPYFVGISLREGFLLALVLVFSLILGHLGKFCWWSFSIILIIPVIAEIYFLYK